MRVSNPRPGKVEPIIWPGGGWRWAKIVSVLGLIYLNRRFCSLPSLNGLVVTGKVQRTEIRARLITTHPRPENAAVDRVLSSDLLGMAGSTNDGKSLGQRGDPSQLRDYRDDLLEWTLFVV